MDEYAAKQYSSWKGFNCCEWRGVECSHSSSHVIQLRFSNNYIAEYFNHTYIYKTLVPVLFQLKHMEYLDLSGNWFSGHLPKELFGLQNLRHLDLSWNNFEGEIPMDVGSIRTLNHLNLVGNEVFNSSLRWVEKLQELGYLSLEGVVLNMTT
ncbi:receptor-like protein 37 isoform X2 [Cryptomeria japonica]|uniref:receptor-like protein 37 isoform X2 n=1 Tax=Cryptomeria japonica TaxID=3369 RepID=UPI0027DA2DBC|nr:receptor-like protein 37 isoform X2 [Cryptomeria japonica]